MLPSRALVDDESAFLSIPGNHDQYSGLPLLPGGRGNFERYFGKGWDLDRDWAEIWFPSSSGALRLFGLEENRGDGEPGEGLAIVCIDLALQAQSHASGKYGYLGQGRVYPEVIADLSLYLQCLQTRAIIREQSLPFGRCISLRIFRLHTMNLNS